MKPEEIKEGLTVFYVSTACLELGPGAVMISEDTIGSVDYDGHEPCCYLTRSGLHVYASRLFLDKFEAGEKGANASVPAANLIATIQANVDNERLSDMEFRQFVRNSLPLVQEMAIKQSVKQPVCRKCGGDRNIKIGISVSGLTVKGPCPDCNIR